MGRLRLLRDERGLALVLALGILTVLSISVAAVIDYTSSNSRTSGYTKSNQVAYTLAETGINNAAAVVANPANNPLDPTLLPSRTTNYDGGSVTWSGTLSTTTWTITSTSTVRNPTGPKAGDVHRKLTATMAILPSLTQPFATSAWSYIYSKRTGNTCDQTLSGEGLNMGSPLYVNGNLCMNADAIVTGSPLVVKGKLTMTALTNRVGSSTTPIAQAHIGNGCQWVTNPLHNPCQGGAGTSGYDNIWATVLDSTPTSITAPTADFAYWYTNADPGPTKPCIVSSGTPPTFDNNSTRDNSVTNIFNLTDNSYTCKTTRGEISYDAPTKTLTVKGVIYIDGSVKVGGGTVKLYKGQASLYVSGTFIIDSTKLCAAVSGTDCDFSLSSGWNPNTALLDIAADGSGGQAGTGNSVQIQSSISTLSRRSPRIRARTSSASRPASTPVQGNIPVARIWT